MYKLVHFIKEGSIIMNANLKSILIVEDDNRLYERIRTSLERRTNASNTPVNIIRFGAIHPAYDYTIKNELSISLISTDMGLPFFEKDLNNESFMGVKFIKLLEESQIHKPILVYSGNEKTRVLDKFKESCLEFPEEKIFNKRDESEEWTQAILDLLKKH